MYLFDVNEYVPILFFMNDDTDFDLNGVLIKKRFLDDFDFNFPLDVAFKFFDSEEFADGDNMAMHVFVE